MGLHQFHRWHRSMWTHTAGSGPGRFTLLLLHPLLLRTQQQGEQRRAFCSLWAGGGIGQEVMGHPHSSNKRRINGCIAARGGSPQNSGRSLTPQARTWMRKRSNPQPTGPATLRSLHWAKWMGSEWGLSEWGPQRQPNWRQPGSLGQKPRVRVAETVAFLEATPVCLIQVTLPE